MSDRSGYRNHFNGIIDRPRYWSRVLTDREIQEAYAQGHQQAAVVPLPQQVVRHDGGRSHSWLVLADPDAHHQMQQMVEHASARGVKVSPYIQAYSHAKGILWQDLRTGHTKGVDKEVGKFGSEDLLELQKRNVILNEVTPIVVSLNGEQLEAGRDYEVVPGETLATRSGHPENVRSPWALPHIPEDNEPWRLRRLDGGRIPAGGEVQVSYAVASGDETTCSFSPQTWENLEDSVRRSLEITEASYLNLGMDEVWVIRRDDCRACQQNPMSREETLLYAMNRAYEVARQVDSDVQVLLWADMLDEYFKANWAVPLDTAKLDELYNGVNVPEMGDDGREVTLTVQVSDEDYSELSFTSDWDQLQRFSGTRNTDRSF